MPVKFNIGGGAAANKDTAVESDVRYPKTFHSGKSVKARVGSILDCTIKKITPQKNRQTIPSGSYIAYDIEIEGDNNLVSGNIRGGTSIFGVVGDANVINTSTGNLQPASMLRGQKGFSKGKAVDGGIETLDAASFSPSGSSAYNDCKIAGAGQNDHVGFFDFSVTGYIAGKIRICIANLLSGNIRYGARIGGIGGYIEGSFTGDATASSAHIIRERTAGVAGKMISGTMENIGAVDPAKSVLFSSGNVYARMSSGAHITPASSGYPEVSIAQSALANALGITPEKILYGNTILGKDGTVRRYAYAHGKVASSSSQQIGYYASVTLNLGFTPVVGYLIYYDGSNRDITVYAPDNGSSKGGPVLNFNQQKLFGYNSVSWVSGEQGVICNGPNMVLPVARRGVQYDYWFAGYY